MLVKVLKVILLVTVLPQISFAKDHGAGNGGDYIQCSKSSELKEGKYFLDYLAAMMDPSPSWYLESTEEVIELLQNKIPELGNKLEEISRSYEDQLRDSRYVWKNMSPKDIADEDLSFDPPKGCEYTPTQLVLKRTFNDTRFYLFADRAKIEQIKKQKSWIFLHEVLWEYYDNAFEIRVVNEMIHDRANYHLTSEQFIQKINNAVSKVDYLTVGNFKMLTEAKKVFAKSFERKIESKLDYVPLWISTSYTTEEIKKVKEFSNKHYSDVEFLNREHKGEHKMYIEDIYWLIKRVVKDNPYK